MKYKIIRSNYKILKGQEEFEKEVQKYLDDGWICQGGIINLGDHFEHKMYCQALIRYDSIIERIQKFVEDII